MQHRKREREREFDIEFDFDLGGKKNIQKDNAF